MPKHSTFDVVIVGGGLVGMAAAITLAKENLSICLLESIASKDNSHPSYDDRTLVVNRASINFWTNCGIWHTLSDKITAIKKVHVSNKGHFGTVIFDSTTLNVDALAYIVEAKVLGMALKKKIQTQKNITLLCPALLKTFSHDAQAVHVAFQHNGENKTLQAQLMLGADGVNSFIREKLNLEKHVKSYERSAIICNITPENKHNNCAYERLTNKGPTAMLPFVNNRCGFVWTVAKQQAADILALSDSSFLKKAQMQFGYRLGKFLKVGTRSCYPLYLIKVPKQVKSRTILLGNAAHTMSPVSAQGLNLAVRDVANLVATLQKALRKNDDIGSDKTLNDYQQSTSHDQQQTMRYTDDLMEWFKIDSPIIASLRSAALLSLEQSHHLKSRLFARASGFRVNMPALLREKYEKI